MPGHRRMRRSADAIAQALSGSDPAAVYVPHPIQDRTDAEMTAIADDGFEAILAQLVQRTA